MANHKYLDDSLIIVKVSKMIDSVIQSEIPQNRVKAENGRLQFKPGVSGNPGGRPKTGLFREEALKFLAAHPKERLGIIKRLAKTKPDFLVQLVDGKLVETSVKVDASSQELDNVIDALARWKAQKQDAKTPTT